VRLSRSDFNITTVIAKELAHHRCYSRQRPLLGVAEVRTLAAFWRIACSMLS